MSEPSNATQIATGTHLKHGCRTTAVLLPTDDIAAFNALTVEMEEHFAPDDLTEHRFVRDMVSAEWRLARVREGMHRELAARIEQLRPEHPDLDPVALEARAIATMSVTGCSWETWLRYESRCENQYEKANRGYIRYQEQQRKVQSWALDMRRKTFRQDLEEIAKTPIEMPAPRVEATQNPTSNVQNAAHQQLAPSAARPNIAPQSVQIARNAPCPCGSKEKYKRCCGKSAPPVLHQAAA